MKLLLSVFFLIFQTQQPPVDLDNIPAPVAECLKAESERLEISRRINPFYLRGDFDGDGQLDYVVLVQHRKSEKQGFAFCFASNKRKPHIVGAGTSIALEGGVRRDDLAAFDLWGVAEAWSKQPKKDALFLAKAESGSGILLWNGTRMVWRQTAI
jgi:hypothetical protein